MPWSLAMICCGAHEGDRHSSGLFHKRDVSTALRQLVMCRKHAAARGCRPCNGHAAAPHLHPPVLPDAHARVGGACSGAHMGRRFKEPGIYTRDEVVQTTWQLQCRPAAVLSTMRCLWRCTGCKPSLLAPCPGCLHPSLHVCSLCDCSPRSMPMMGPFCLAVASAAC